MGVKFKKILYLLVVTCNTLSLTRCQQRLGNFARSPPLINDPYLQEDVHFFGPPSGSFWEQFWDTFNYKGPLQDDTFSRPLTRPSSRPLFSDFDFQNQFSRPNYQDQYQLPIQTTRPVYQDAFSIPNYKDQFSRPDYPDQYSKTEYFVPRRETFRPIREEETVSNKENAYNRYRDYFFRRYGTNTVD